MGLTDRERQIVEIIHHDPLVGASAIAEKLGSTRSAVLVHLSNLGKKGFLLGRGYILREERMVLVIGGSTLDLKCRSAAALKLGTSNPGTTSRSAGGVGRNIADNLARLGTNTTLVTAIGQDAGGELLMQESRSAGVHLSHVIKGTEPTGRYTAVLDSSGEMVVAIADMTAMEALRPEHLLPARDLMRQASMVILDGNLPPEALRFALESAASAAVKVLLDPVSTPKAARLAPLLGDQRPVHTLTPNRSELEAISGQSLENEASILRAAAALHERGVEQVWVRMGEGGSLLSTRKDGAPEQSFLPATPYVAPEEVQDVTGAGDAALAAFAHALLQGFDPRQAARFGHAAAALTIRSPNTVRSDMSFALLEATLQDG